MDSFINFSIYFLFLRWWLLENCSSKLLYRFRQLHLRFNGIMQSNNTHVFLSRTLLSFYQSSGSVQANNQAARHFRIQRTTMSCFFDSQNFFDPSHNFMGRWVRGFIQVNNTIFQIFLKRPFKG